MAKVKKQDDKNDEGLTLSKKLSNINIDTIRMKENPGSAKKVKKEEPEKKSTSLKESISKIDSSRVNVYSKEKKANIPKDDTEHYIKETISNSKSSRGPAMSNRLTGMKTFKSFIQ